MAANELQSLIDQSIPIRLDNNLDYEGGPSPSSALISWIVPPGADIPPYWSRTRDKWLRDFWTDNVALKTAVATFVNKAVTVPFTIQARDRSIMRHVRQAKKFETDLRRNSGTINIGPMRGFKQTLKQFLIDLVTQDNGSFLLIMGGGPADGPIVGAPAGLMHLDSSLCNRTSNPEFPVVYQHTDGHSYKIHHARIIDMVNLPSPDASLNGIGLSAVSCCVEAAREIWDIYRYSQEKFGSRPPRQILYAETGATINALTAAIEHWSVKLDQESRSHFGGTLIVAPSVPTAELRLRTLDLSSPPDGFDRETAILQNKSEIAAAFGMDLLDLAMSFGLQGQTRANAGIQDRKGRGKGVGEVLETLKERMEEYYLPAHLEFKMDYLDDDQDEQRAIIHNTRSQARQRDILSEITTIRIERERMLEDGEITQEQFEDMELESGRLPTGLDVLLLFQSQDSKFQAWLDIGIPDPTNVKVNEPESTLQLIHEQRLNLSSEIHGTANPETLRMARQAIAALDHLKKLYESEVMQLQMMANEEEQEEETSNNSEELDDSEDKPDNNPDMKTPPTADSREDMRRRHTPTQGEKSGVTFRPRGYDKPLPPIPEDFIKYVDSIATELDKEVPVLDGILNTKDG